jgi:SAM-dependent methyltransferase
MWHGALLPRIQALLPTRTILEIAPGYGRWTQYLKDQCDHLVVIDLSERCIEHCRERFADAKNITYHVNDGRSLEAVQDGSIDFVFSFDSLVHADPSVVAGYLQQLRRKLTPDGVGFIHHSNAGALKLLSGLSRRVPTRYYEALRRRGLLVNLTAWRDTEMSAALFRDQCTGVGLSCATQELISWEFGRFTIDCLSTFAMPESRWDRDTRVLRNPLFVAEGRRMARLYSPRSFAPPDITA